MCAGRIIADTDDEDDFSPVPSPVGTGASASGRGNVPGSSDPGFFRTEYHVQQEAAIYDPGSTTDTASDLFPNGEELATRGDRTDTYDPWAIVSSPESLRDTPKAKNPTRSGDLKTYPKEKEGSSSNTPSPKDPANIGKLIAKNATPSKPLTTYSKKESGVNSSATSHHNVIDMVSPDQRRTTKPASKGTKRNPDAEYRDGSSRPTKKKKRISDLRTRDAGGLEEGSADVPSSLDIPDTTSMAPPMRRSADNGPSGDSRQLYVEPSRMTSSQKGQYEEVSFPLLSSLDEPQNLGQYTHLARSSGSATIAYPTPTQYRRPDPDSQSMPPASHDISLAGSRRGTTKRRRLSSLPPTADNPSSSPDAISGAPDGNDVQPEVETEPPIVELDNSCDEDWNEADHGFPKPQGRQPTRTKKGQRTAKNKLTGWRDGITPTAGYMNGAEARAMVDHQPTPKKRGRKKKEKVTDPEPVAPVVAAHAEDAAPQKRKRGRPKKSDKVGAAGNVSAEDPKPPEVERGPETSHNVEDGSEKASCRDTDAKKRDEQDNREDAEVDAKKDDDRDADVSPKPRIPADTGHDAVEALAAATTNVSTGKESAADRKQEPATKVQPSTPGKSGGMGKVGAKPIYRVGLSKRSRITPLLKCIRKS